jgi:hypothetical protein
VTNDYFYVEPEKVFPFASFERSTPVEIYRNGRKVRIFWITYCRRFDLGRLPAPFTSELVGPRGTVKDGVRRIDHRLFWLINRDLHVPFLDYAMWALTLVDTGLQANSSFLVFLILTAVLLRQKQKDRFWSDFLLMIAIIMVGGIIVHLIKDWVGRERPLALFGDQARSFAEKLYRGSFPSGHTQIAFSAATFLTVKFRKYWGILHPGVHGRFFPHLHRRPLPRGCCRRRVYRGSGHAADPQAYQVSFPEYPPQKNTGPSVREDPVSCIAVPRPGVQPAAGKYSPEASCRGRADESSVSCFAGS